MRRYLLILFGLPPVLTYASHLRAGEITTTPINCTTYQITLTAYVSLGSPIPFGDGTLDFGDGATIVVPNQSATVIDTYNQVGKVVYTSTHSYANPGNYTVSYTEANRNGGILNISGSLQTRFYIEASVSVGVCNNSPQFLVAPIDRACKGKVFYHDPGAFDPDDDSLSFELTIPGAGRGLAVSNYSLPNDPRFYNGLNYDLANEAGNGKPIFIIDAITGLLTWDSPGQIGEYAVAFKIIEWRKNKITQEWTKIGYTLRDMQIVVEDCTNQRPDLIVPATLCVEAGEIIELKIKGIDPDNDPVKIEVFSEALDIKSSPPVVLRAGESQPSPSEVILKWITQCSHIRNKTYDFTFKITDLPAKGTRLVAFKTMRVKIIGPAPKITAITINPVAKTAKLEWNSYLCADITFQVWRRVASYEYNQPPCNTGMQKFLGFTLLTELPAATTSFTDSDLATGAQYCYRILARFNSSSDTYSHLSVETCFIPRKAEAPVITNVSVNKTNADEGAVQIVWTKPFDIDPIQYPEPYRYEVWRSNGLDGQIFTKVSGQLSGLSFTDVVRTLDTTYRYQVHLYVPSLSDASVATSSNASSIRAKSFSFPSKIKIQWKANVPWANNLKKYPWHYIYRGTAGLDGPFQLLDSLLVDSIDVNKEDFYYVDKSSPKNLLPSNQIFFYKIKTKGGYGNPGIKEPLINFSPVVPAHTLDTIPPLSPIVKGTQNCEEQLASYSCDTKTFSNSILWEPAADDDMDHYKIYVSDSVDGNYVLLKDRERSTTFVHTNISKLAYCYRIATVDKAGNESDLSEPFCTDNCPYLALPNVFTPDNNDGYNDYFGSIGCSAFVKTLTLKIFDRYGKQVFVAHHQNDTPLQWDGRDANNKELPAGIYFYAAEANFDVMDATQAQKKLRGWVHLVR